MGPSAPAKLAPEATPGADDAPKSDSTDPIPASTVHGRPGHDAAAATSQATYDAGTSRLAGATLTTSAAGEGDVPAVEVVSPMAAGGATTTVEGNTTLRA